MSSTRRFGGGAFLVAAALDARAESATTYPFDGAPWANRQLFLGATLLALYPCTKASDVPGLYSVQPVPSQRRELQTGPACTETCGFASDGVCDDGGPGAEWLDCSRGTDCTDCGPRFPPPRPPSRPPPPPRPPSRPPSPSPPPSLPPSPPPPPYLPGTAVVSTSAGLIGAVANRAVGHIVLAPGTYNLTAELFIDRSVILEAAVAGSVVLNARSPTDSCCQRRVLGVYPGSFGRRATDRAQHHGRLHKRCGRRCSCHRWHSHH